MNGTYKRIGAVTAWCLIFAITQMGTGMSSAKSGTPAEFPEPYPPPLAGVLKTNGNRPITVNGSNAASGATIMTGSIIETPDQVGGTISLGSFSNLEIEPNTKIKIDFDQDGNVKVTLIRGCAAVRAKKNVIGEVDTEQGVAGKTDPKRRFLSVCFAPGAAAPTVSVAAGAAAVGGGLLTAILVVAGIGVVTGILIPRGGNPSPSSP